jgi:TPM domain
MPAPSQWKRPLLLILVGAALILGLLKLTWWRYPTHLYDEARLFDRDERETVSRFLAELTRATGADVRILTTRSIGTEPLRGFALRRMRELEIGETTDRRGILVVLDLERNRTRIEVGPKLEGLITDRYSGYLARDVLGPMLEAKAKPLRLMSVLYHVLRFRIDEGLLGKEWNPAELSGIHERQRLALGGGADAVATLDDLRRLANQPTPAQLKARYAAQATAADALVRYLEWAQEPFLYADVGLISGLSRDIMTTIDADVPVGAWRFDQPATAREQYQLVVRGVRAIGIPTVSPLSHPVWLVRERGGWQYELTPEYTSLSAVPDGPFTWTMLWQDDPWIREFGDLMVGTSDSRVYRFRDGNNTPLPTRGSYR